MAYKNNDTTVINDSRRAFFNKLNLGAYTNSNKPTGFPTGTLIYNNETKKLETL